MPAAASTTKDAITMFGFPGTRFLSNVFSTARAGGDHPVPLEQPWVARKAKISFCLRRNSAVHQRAWYISPPTIFIYE